MSVEYQDQVTNQIEADELYPMQTYTGLPEFAIADHEKFDQSGGGQMPFLRFHTPIKEDELLPVPENHSLDYTKIMWELERWTLFKSLPSIMEFDANAKNIFTKISNGTIKVPDYVNDVNPPSLNTYFSTLPSFARNDPFIRNAFMAYEHHHHGDMDIRQKENALNMACSFLRPIDTVMKEVLIIACISNKEQMTMKKGQELLNEI